MNTTWRARILGFALALSTVTASAQIFSGRFDDATNAALFGSALGAAQFDNANDIANNVALLSVVVPVAGVVTVTSTGFASGGADPYFSLFRGSGATATFLASNFVQAFSTGGDFAYAATLAAGVYEIALGTFANLSFAENLGTGTLADGFVGLGEPSSLGDSGYRLIVTTPVPEPSVFILLAVGVLLLHPWRRELAARRR